jgi:hypothetical protein
MTEAQARCLHALEVAPTVLSGCRSWAEAQRRLAAETIDALARSLPLLRSPSGVTNWELAFGSPDAVVRRIVSLDEIPPPDGGFRCVSEMDGKTAAVVEISGRILGEGAPFTPDVMIAEEGATVSPPRPRRCRRFWRGSGSGWNSRPASSRASCGSRSTRARSSTTSACGGRSSAASTSER